MGFSGSVAILVLPGPYLLLRGKAKCQKGISSRLLLLKEMSLGLAAFVFLLTGTPNELADDKDLSIKSAQ